MGGTYFVPRSVKGESRILLIFSVKSFILTLITGLLGAGIWYLLGAIGINIGFVPGLVLVSIFGAVGFCVATLKIPDVPIMGKLRKAGGENVGDILFRLATFKPKKKIYLYGYKRESIKRGNTNDK